MSPELERLLAAMWERDTCEPKDRPRWVATVDRLVHDALGRQPGIGYDRFMVAIDARYREFRRARRRPPTMPPRA
jgi:hypothetical protein